MVSHRASIDRRRFLELGVATTGLAVSACPAGDPRAESRTSGGMRYRPLGRTGLKVSEVAFGAHQIDNTPLMQAALDAGINTFCTSGSYLDGKEEASIGRVVRAVGPGRRGELVLITGDSIRPGTSRERILSLIESSLRRLGTDHIDVYYLGEACSAADLRVDVMRYSMYFSSYGREKEAMRLYAALPGERSAAACDVCAAPCEGACPFGRAIRAGMVAAHRRLSFTEA